MTKLENSNCDKTLKLNLKNLKKNYLKNSKNVIVTKLKYSNCDSSYRDISDSSSNSDILVKTT